MDDPDGDGFLTWQEYWSGTDPMNSNSYLNIAEISLSGTNVSLIWQHAQVDNGLPDIKIQGTSNLLNGVWSEIGQKTPVNGINSWVTPSGNLFYYRLTAESP